MEMLNVKIDMTDVVMTFGEDKPDTTICVVYEDSKEIYRVKGGVLQYCIVWDAMEPLYMKKFEDMTDDEFKDEEDRISRERSDDAEAWEEEKLIERDGDWAGAR